MGMWNLRYGKGEYTYQIDEHGVFKVVYCLGKCSITISYLEKSTNEAFSANQGWWLVDQIHEENIFLYIRVSKGLLETFMNTAISGEGWKQKTKPSTR